MLTVELYDGGTWLKKFGMWYIPVKAKVICPDGKLRMLHFGNGDASITYHTGRIKARKNGRSYTIAGILSIRHSDGKFGYALHFVPFGYRKNGQFFA